MPKLTNEPESVVNSQQLRADIARLWCTRTLGLQYLCLHTGLVVLLGWKLPLVPTKWSPAPQWAE